MRWFYLFMLRRSNERLEVAVDNLPDEWVESHDEFLEEVFEYIQARMNVIHWMEKLER
jgi:hypothetical protein